MDGISQLSHQDKLRRISFFSSLPPDMLSALAAKLRHVHYRHGEVVFVEDSVGDSLYFIESGQVKVSVGSGPDERIINYLGPGNFFGELAVLLNQRRTANVTVVIDADFWVLRKSDLDALLEKYPANAIQISRELSRRLTDTIQRPIREERYNLVAVVGHEPWRLAARVTRLSGEKIALLDLTGTNLAERVSEALPDNIVIHSASPHLTEQETVEILGVLADTHDRVLASISPEQGDASAKTMQLAKATVLVDVEERPWMAGSASGPIWRIAGTEQEIDRMARRLAQRVVGLALSSGGARGIAHVGVLKVLAREGIPIDILVGTSAGALFGGLYATGQPVESIVEFALCFYKALRVHNLLDLAVPPRTGLLRGHRYQAYLDRLFQGITFEDLELPFYAVAADVLTGEEVVFEAGSVADAVRASTSIVGILSPAKIDGRYLVDGGAVNPLPVSVLAEKGADVIIASRAIPTLEDERESRQATGSARVLNIVGVLTNFQSIMEREIIKTRLSLADVIICPRVEAYAATEYRQAAEFIRLGEEATEQAMPEIKQKVLAESS